MQLYQICYFNAIISLVRGGDSLSSRLKKNLLLFALVFIGIFILNYMTIFTSDDLSYHYIYQSFMPTENTARVSSLADVVQSISNHYKQINGRSFSHFLLQSVLIFDKPVFNIINSLAYLGLGLLIMAHIERNKEARTLAKYIIIYSLMFIFIPQFGQSMLWVSGAANYLWMANFILLASLGFRKWDLGEKVRPLWAIFLNFLAGSSSENGGGMVILFGLFFLAKWTWEKRRFNPGAFLSVLAGGLGLLIQLVAPGNKIRITRTSGEIYPRAWLERSLEIMGPLLLILLILVIISKLRKGKLSIPMVFYLLSSLAAALILIITPNLAARSWLWSVVFLIIALGVQAKEIKLSKAKLKYKILTFLALALALTASYNYWGALVSNLRSYTQHQATLRQVESQKAQGIKDLRVKKFDMPTNKYNALYQTYHLREDPEYWFNQWFAFYYGVDSVTVTNPEQSR